MLASLLTQAGTVIQHCLKVRPGDEVLLVSDESLSPDMLDTFRAAAVQAGAREHVMTYQPFNRYAPHEYSRFAGASLRTDQLELSSTLISAMQGADAILFLHSDLELFFVPAFIELSRRKRIISLLYLSVDSALRLLPSSAEEVQSLRGRMEAGEKLLNAAQQARITTPAGTDITFSLGQYPAMIQSGFVDDSGMSIIPGGQVLRVPNDGSASGRFVIDRTIAVHTYKVVSEPITFYVERGDVIRVEGGLEGQRLSRWLEDLRDPRIYHVTELAFGVNPRCRLTGVAAPAEDTRNPGTVSLALGCDVHLKGSNPAPAHCDMTMRLPTLELDGSAIITDGTLQF